MTTTQQRDPDGRRADPVTVAVVTRSAATSGHVERALAPYSRRALFVDHHVDHHVDPRTSGPTRLVQVVVLELARGDDDELAALCELVAEPVAVVAVVSIFQPALASRAVELGARACVLPDVSGAELASVVESVAAGRDAAAPPDRAPAVARSSRP